MVSIYEFIWIISFRLYVRSSRFIYPMSIGTDGRIQVGGTIISFIIKSEGA